MKVLFRLAIAFWIVATVGFTGLYLWLWAGNNPYIPSFDEDFYP